MKVLTIVALFIVSAMLVLGVSSSGNEASAQEGKKLPEVLTLAPESKLGSVKFSHTDHVTKNRSVDGTKPIACVECHHTAQPASEAAKTPPLKTAWPADRTTTLTEEVFAKDPAAA